MASEKKSFHKRSANLLRWIWDHVSFSNIGGASHEEWITITKTLFIYANEFVVKRDHKRFIKPHLENESEWVGFSSSITRSFSSVTSKNVGITLYYKWKLDLEFYPSSAISFSQYNIDEHRYNTTLQTKTSPRVLSTYWDDIVPIF